MENNDKFWLNHINMLVLMHGTWPNALHYRFVLYAHVSEDWY